MARPVRDAISKNIHESKRLHVLLYSIIAITYAVSNGARLTRKAFTVYYTSNARGWRNWETRWI